jgi:hypothetical protein
MPYTVRINFGKVELRNNSGMFMRIIGSNDTIDADINSDGSLILITTGLGRVELRKESGTVIKTIITKDAKGAKFNGNEIQIRMKDGGMEIKKIAECLLV